MIEIYSLKFTLPSHQLLLKCVAYQTPSMGFTINDYDLRNTFRTERNLLLFSGFYPRRKNKYNFLYIFSAALNIIISVMQLLSMIVQLVIDRNDLSKLSECLLFFVTHVTFLCKLTNFEYYNNNLLDIEDMLTKSIFYGFENDQLRHLKNKIASCRMIAKIFRTMCIIAVLLYGSVPLLDRNKTMSLPLPGWLPYNTTRYYYQKVSFQMISISITASNNSSIDILTWMLISIASAQFDILKDNFKNIYYKFGAIDNKMHFGNCMRHHSEIVSLVSKIESIFSKGIFLQFFASVVVICFTGFQMIVVSSILSFQFGFLVMYFLCMMWQVGMYCWFGHDVMTTSNEIGQFFYLSNWYESNIKIRKSMCIFLERTKKPVTLTAGKFITLSLSTFTGILRMSYSYFAVLQHLYDNKES